MADPITDILVADSKADLNVFIHTTEDGTRMSSCCSQNASSSAGPTNANVLPSVSLQRDLNDWVGKLFEKECTKDFRCANLVRVVQDLRSEGLHPMRYRG